MVKYCSKCGLNFVLEDSECECKECRNEKLIHRGSFDNNKNEVEQYLLPILRGLPQSALDSLMTKEFSFELLHLRLPLLKKCRGLGKEGCKEEVIIDNSTVYRYYITPYDINGQKYHICSQWWDAQGNDSKFMLELLKNLK